MCPGLFARSDRRTDHASGLWVRVRTGILACSLIAAVVGAFQVQQAQAQEFRGRINGVVTDDSGAILPGVTVTATSPALIQTQVATTGEDGNYRLIALPPGLYTVSFELTGFQSVKQENVRVVIGQTLSVDIKLAVATLQEAVTVQAEAPVLDRTTTTVSTNFTKELLTEIPNARDIWAAMSQAPGLQMTGYDVGGSHTGTQTGYITYGLSQQNTTKLEGINTTEAASANAGYFDFGSFEEFQVGGAGNGAEQDVPGASLNVTVKSGGDNFSGTWYSDWEGKGSVSNNVANELTVPGGIKDGYKAPNSAGGLRSGNPIDRQYDLNASGGGPLYRGKAWFFVSYRLNDQYRTIIGLDQLAQSKLTNYTGKGTFQLSRSNQLIGFWNKRTKLQPLRDFSTLVPVSASYYQGSRNYPMKLEWTSILSDRLFLSVLGAQWYNFFPLRPTYEGGIGDRASLQPGRQDLDTLAFFDGGANNYYQDRKRYKPQFAATLSYFKDGWKGSHDLKLGFEWKRDRRHEGNDQPFDIFYRDRAGVPVEVDLYNTPVVGTTDVKNHSSLSERRLEAHQPAHAESRSTHRTLRRWLARTAAGAERHSGARRDQRSAHHELPRGTHGRRARRRGDVDGRPAHRLRLRHQRHGPPGREGLLRPLLFQLGGHHRRQRKPGRRRVAALSDDRSQRQPSARRPRTSSARS